MLPRRRRGARTAATSAGDGALGRSEAKVHTQLDDVLVEIAVIVVEGVVEVAAVRAPAVNVSVPVFDA